MALYNHGVRQGVGTSMSASCAAGWGAYLYPFYSQMAKVELLETVWKIARGLLGCGYGWCPVSKNSASWPLVANLQSSS